MNIISGKPDKIYQQKDHGKAKIYLAFAFQIKPQTECNGNRNPAKVEYTSKEIAYRTVILCKILAGNQSCPNEAFSYAHYTEEGGKIKGEFRSVRNKGGDVAFWRVKSALSLGIDQLAFSLGYTISNQDPYSGRRNVCFDGHKISPSRGTYKFLHECSVSLSYSF